MEKLFLSIEVTTLSEAQALLGYFEKFGTPEQVRIIKDFIRKQGGKGSISGTTDVYELASQHGLAPWAMNVLVTNEVHNYGQLLACSQRRLRDMRNGGQRLVNEVNALVERIQNQI